METKIEKQYCIVDYTGFEQYKNVAGKWAKYFDEKCPKVAKMIGLDVNDIKKTNIVLRGDNEVNIAGWDTCSKQIKVNPKNIKDGNLGFLTHEATHALRDLPKRDNWKWVSEGMADYVRLKLGWDGECEDPPFSSSMINKNISLNNQTNYRVWRDFFEWIVERYKGDLLKDFTKALKQGCTDDNFLYEKFNKTADELWEEYVSQV